MNFFHAINSYTLGIGITSSLLLQKFWQSIDHKLLEELIATTRRDEVIKIFSKVYAKNERYHSHFKTVSLWIDSTCKHYENILRSDISVVSVYEDAFPLALKFINDPPILLYRKGEHGNFQENAFISIVGTRAASILGRKVARRFAFEAALAGVVTVSGLARGVDSEIWYGAESFSAKTVAVLPTLDSNRRIFPGALLVAEYPPDVIRMEKRFFLERNRLIAALSPGTVIIEAPPKSGALSTADLALSYGRQVYLYAQDSQSFLSRGGMNFAFQNNLPFIHTLAQVMQDIFPENYRNFQVNLHKFMQLGNERDDKLAMKKSVPFFGDLRSFLWSLSSRDSEVMQKVVIELKRQSIIEEYKGQLLLNLLYSPDSWPKT